MVACKVPTLPTPTYTDNKLKLVGISMVSGQFGNNLYCLPIAMLVMQSTEADLHIVINSYWCPWPITLKHNDKPMIFGYNARSLPHCPMCSSFLISISALSSNYTMHWLSRSTDKQFGKTGEYSTGCIWRWTMDRDEVQVPDYWHTPHSTCNKAQSERHVHLRSNGAWSKRCVVQLCCVIESYHGNNFS